METKTEAKPTSSIEALKQMQDRTDNQMKMMSENIAFDFLLIIVVFMFAGTLALILLHGPGLDTAFAAAGFNTIVCVIGLFFRKITIMNRDAILELAIQRGRYITVTESNLNEMYRLHLDTVRDSIERFKKDFDKTHNTANVTSAVVSASNASNKGNLN